MSDQTSLNLLARLRQKPGDGDAWDRFVSLYSPWLRGWVWRLARLPEGHHDTDEILQEVFLVVCKKFPEFEHNGQVGAFRAWLKAILINCLRDYQRRKPRPSGEDPGPLLDQLAAPDSDLSRLFDDEHHSHVVRQLCERGQKRFTPYSWEVFKRTSLEGQTPSRVAFELGVSVNAVLLARSRILAWFRQEGGDLLE